MLRKESPGVRRAECAPCEVMGSPVDAVGIRKHKAQAMRDHDPSCFRVFSQHLPVASLFLGVTLSVCLAEGGISWFRQAQPLVPLPVVLPMPAVVLQPCSQRWEQVLWPEVDPAG